MTAIVAFYGFASLAILSACVILFTRNVMYAALGLFTTLLAVAALYVLAGADFLAIAQLLVYVGGVLVLVIFGIMLTHRTDETEKSNRILTKHGHIAGAVTIAIGTFLTLFWVINHANFAIIHSQSSSGSRSTIRRIGIGLMTDYVWAFEIIGILLLIALVGAAYLATQRPHSES